MQYLFLAKTNVTKWTISTGSFTRLPQAPRLTQCFLLASPVTYSSHHIPTELSACPRFPLHFQLFPNLIRLHESEGTHAPRFIVTIPVTLCLRHRVMVALLPWHHTDHSKVRHNCFSVSQAINPFLQSDSVTLWGHPLTHNIQVQVEYVLCKNKLLLYSPVSQFDELCSLQVRFRWWKQGEGLELLFFL